MILRLFRRPPRNPNIASLYGMIVAQARSPAFYRGYGVPDTINGRFEMIALHAVMVLARLEQAGADGRRLGQGVFDRFCRDMDDSMREMGVGDLAVPRKMRRIGAAFYERQREYRDALAAPDCGALEAALARNVLEAAPPSDAARRLAHYVRSVERMLAAQQVEALIRGELPFPAPETVADPIEA